MIWFLKIIIDLAFMFLALTLSPVVALFVDKNWMLPHGLSWFQTQDSRMNGQWGDWRFGQKYIKYAGTKLGRWYTAVRWQWRNTGQGFSQKVMGFDVHPAATITLRGTRSFGGETSENGWYFARAANPDGKSAWQLYVTYHYKKLPGYLFRLNFGWKLWGIRAHRCQIVCAITPFKKLQA